MKTLRTFFRKSMTALAAAGTLLSAVSCTMAEQVPGSGKDSVYLFTSFQNKDQKFLRFLYSDDGYHWTNVPGTFLEANVGAAKQIRDPSLVCGSDGTFHLVWTSGWADPRGFGYASSKDLIHWSEQQFVPAMTNEPTTVNTWAPELFYDPPQKQYVIVWASTIPGRFPDYMEAHTNNHRLYYTTTQDFKKFAPTKLFLDPGFSVIDAFIVQDGDRYVLACKDNSRPNLSLRVAFGKSPLGPWENMSEPITHKFTEGPSVLKIGEDWIIYFDPYREKHYGAAKTRDFKTFTDITSEMSFPEGHRHGTALRVPREILDGLLKSQATLSQTNL